MRSISQKITSIVAGIDYIRVPIMDSDLNSIVASILLTITLPLVIPDLIEIQLTNLVQISYLLHSN